MALRIICRSASVGANSAARDTDLCGAKTKSNPEFLRTCWLQSSPVSAQRASNRASSWPSRGAARALAMPSAAATRGSMSGRQFAAACVVGGKALPGFEVAAVEGDAMHLERLGFRLILGHVGADRRAVARGGDFPEIEHGDQAWPAPLTGAWAVAASAGARRVRASLIWRSKVAMPDCWVRIRARRSASDGPS